MKKGRVWSGLSPLVSRTHALALADQVVVSGTSFLATVMIAHWTDPSQLGAYAIGISLLFLALAIQDSLVLLPYAIQRHHPLGTPADHAGSSLLLSGLLSAVINVTLIIIALGLAVYGARVELVAMTWVLVAVMPFVLSREFGRRFAFAHLRISLALIVDVAVAVTQLAILAWLGWSGRMSAVTACMALGGSCGLTVIGWLYLARGDFSIHLDQVRAAISQSWGLGKWLLAGQLTLNIQRYITYWLAGVIAGAAVTGVYTACMSIVSFANPLIFGLGNILTPRSVLAWKDGGGAGLRRQAIRDALLIGMVMSLFCVAVLFAGEHMMGVLYHGNDFKGHGQILTLLALANLAAAIGMPASNALASMERPRAIVVVNTLGAILALGLAWWLMEEWGLLGAAYGFLSGNLVGAVGRWAAFLALVPGPCDTTAVIRVLQKLTRRPDADRWSIERLGEGDHAIVYVVRSTDREPLWQAFHNLVVKLYKAEAALNVEMAHAQFASLSRLHATLDGGTSNGWKVLTPRPLYLCKSPLALVMTGVPGRDLNTCKARGENLIPEMLGSAGRAFAVAMEEGWSRGELHGDLGLRNVLLDVQGKALSFIDPGTLESCCVCNDGSEYRSRAALDLGHLLSDLGTDVMDMVGGPDARARGELFAEGVLRTLIETAGPWEEKQRLLEEVRACVQAHLCKTLVQSWSLRGLWRGCLKKIAIQRIDSMLERLKGQLDGCGEVT